MPDRLAGIPVIGVENTVAKRITSFSQLPGKNFSGVCRISESRGVLPVWSRISKGRSAIKTDQPILTPNLPVVPPTCAVVFNPGKQPFSTRPVAGYIFSLEDRHEVFGPGENKGVSCIVITRHPFISFATDTWNTQAPAQPKGTIATAGAINKIE